MVLTSVILLPLSPPDSQSRSVNKMKTPPRLPRLLFLLLSIAAIACYIASFRSQRVSAFAANGRIAFTSDNVIYTINPDGAGLLQLTQTGNGFQDRFPVWSPDGTKIAFGRTTFTAPSQIYVMNADGTNPTRLSNNAFSDRQPSWSPDGTRIAFISARDGNDEIYVMNADGSNQTRLTNNNSFDWDPAWSPDGTRIAFASTRDFASTPGNVNDFLELYVMNADGSNPVRLTNNTKGDGQPSWSPDGTKIAFTTQRDGLALIYVMNSNGSNQVNLTQSTTLDSADAEWSPDGTTIAFTSYQRVGQTNSDEIFLMNADGTNVRRISFTSFDEHDLAWQALGAAPSPTPTPTPSPTPTPGPSLTVSGNVKHSNGQPLPGVVMILTSDVADPQIVFTDQAGNYSFTHSGGGSSLTVTPSREGFVFDLLSVSFIFPSGNKTVPQITGTPSPIPLPIQQPILLSHDSPQHAIALDSALLTTETFGVINNDNFSGDHRTRISLFAVNIELAAGEPISVITAQAEDSLGNVFTLPVEAYVAVPNFTWLKQVVVKLPDEIANKVEVRVSIKVRGIASNKVIVKVKP